VKAQEAVPYDLPRLYRRDRFGKPLKADLATGKGHEGRGEVQRVATELVDGTELGACSQ
jgi:hypothetical protein